MTLLLPLPQAASFSPLTLASGPFASGCIVLGRRAAVPAASVSFWLVTMEASSALHKEKDHGAYQHMSASSAAVPDANNKSQHCKHDHNIMALTKC
jgi:hypothetical protein